MTAAAIELGARYYCPLDWEVMNVQGKTLLWGHRHIEEGFDGYHVMTDDEEKNDD